MHHEGLDLFVIPNPADGRTLPLTWTPDDDGGGTLTAGEDQTLTTHGHTPWTDVVHWLRTLLGTTAALLGVPGLADTPPI